MSAQQLVRARWSVGLVVSAGEGRLGSNAADPLGEEGKGSTAQEGEVYVSSTRHYSQVLECVF